MDKYYLWKLKFQGKAFKKTGGTVYYGCLDSVAGEVKEIIESLKDGEQWSEITPHETETKRWQNKRGDFITISMPDKKHPEDSHK